MRRQVAAQLVAAAAAAIVLLTGCARPASIPNEQPASATLIGLGQVGDRAAVPWSQVGDGWFLVTEDTSRLIDVSASAPMTQIPGVRRSWLVDPLGGKYLLDERSATDGSREEWLQAWSWDGRHVLYSHSDGRVTEVDLASGRTTHTFALPVGAASDLIALSYADPQGDRLLMWTQEWVDGAGAGAGLRVLDLTGRVRARLLTNDAVPAVWSRRSLVAVDGTKVFLSGRDGLRVVAMSGGPVRAVGVVSAGGTCDPVRWWASHTILAVCNAGPATRLWLVPDGGGAATPLTTPVAAPGSGAASSDSQPPDRGSVDAVKLAGGAVYLQRPTECGGMEIAALQPDGSGRRVDIPDSLGTDLLIGATADKLAVVSYDYTECGRSSWFGFYDPARNVTTRIVTDAPGESGAGALAYRRG